MWDMTCPLRSAADVGQRSECAMVMSVTTQTIFPYMSDAHRPAVDVQMAAQDACVPLSFWLILSAIFELTETDNATWTPGVGVVACLGGAARVCVSFAVRCCPGLL